LRKGLENGMARSVLSDMADSYLQKVGDLLKSRMFTDGATVSVLRELHYIKNDRLNIPIITLDDMASVRPLIDSVDQTVLTWLKARSGGFQRVFADVTPMRMGVDFREVLIHLWHYIFGHTNKHLCRMGILYSPYSSSSDWPGYLPVVWERSCNLW
jgi:hypothetical protein